MKTSEKLLRCAYVVLCSAIMAVFFVSGIFLSDLISMKTNLIVTFAYITLVSALYGAMLVGSPNVEFLIKWALSLPISYLVINWFWKTQFAVRSLNWVFRGYERQSMGGKFAGFMLLMSLMLGCLIAMAVSLRIKPKNTQLFRRIQLCAGVALTAVIIAVCVHLEGQFPTYEEIFCG